VSNTSLSSKEDALSDTGTRSDANVRSYIDVVSDTDGVWGGVAAPDVDVVSDVGIVQDADVAPDADSTSDADARLWVGAVGIVPRADPTPTAVWGLLMLGLLNPGWFKGFAGFEGIGWFPTDRGVAWFCAGL
jgi:hypothetical protein